MPTREKVIALMEEINPDIDYETATNLVVSGAFDSLCVLDLLESIQDAFDIVIGPEWLTADNFNDVDSIMNMISTILQ